MKPGTGVKIAAWTVVVASAILAVAFSTRFGSDPGLSPSPLIGKPAPEVTLPLLDGFGDVALADLEGQIVVVNFFASWCLECRTEHAELVATSDAYADHGHDPEQGVEQEDDTHEDDRPRRVEQSGEVGAGDEAPEVLKILHGLDAVPFGSVTEPRTIWSA